MHMKVYEGIWAHMTVYECVWWYMNVNGSK